MAGTKSACVRTTLSFGKMRPPIDNIMMDTAVLWSTRSTCVRRSVGAVIADDANTILGVGYNGVAKGVTHCVDSPCSAANAPTGVNIDGCDAVHAEINALLHVKDIRFATTIYVTTSPCVSCVKALLNTPIKRIVYMNEYANACVSKSLWCKDPARSWEAHG